MFISSPLIRGGGWGLGRGGGEELSRTFAGSPQPCGVTMQAVEEPSSCPSHGGSEGPWDFGAGKDLVHLLTVPNGVPSPCDPERSRRCLDWMWEVGMALPPL